MSPHKGYCDMSYSIDASTDACYEGTTCLINKLNIRDEEQLKNVEASYTFARISQLAISPLPESFDFSCYRKMHRFIFQDLYDWAGEIRTIDISKLGTSFMPADQIKSSADACFSRIASLDFSSMSREEFVEEIADFYNTLNILHPFREGNGRVQRLYFTKWMKHLGYEIDFSEVDSDYFMLATIRAAQGVMDDLIVVFTELIGPSQTMNMQQSFL